MTITHIGEVNFELKGKEGRLLTYPLEVNDFKITRSGEYEISGISAEIIDGISILKMEGISIAHLGKRKSSLNDSEKEKLTGLDILFIPIGGGEVMGAKEALEVVSVLEPKVIIPMAYSDLSEFCKQEGLCSEPVESYKVVKNSLPQEERQVVIISQKP